MMEDVSLIDRSYKRVLACEEEGIDEKLERKEQRMAKAANSGPYLVHAGITTAMNRMAGDADENV